ncbi:NUDIX domain-containing protein [Kineosporia rhizophila]|uniref:NUDIX hydrolase n=1 Tax=Kineosporia TaxID=49184 RepID=UPI000A5C188D|nr:MULTISPECIES: NUDIX domain-containing protein [Kineosporia]MCE0539232.1 NUDIX domain-containing protein [Kineosporia rhizophila]GLY14498.1 phosphohydrolase [Kineosporia sp. NBRC 101677]
MPTPEFILALREKIGHDELWLPGVTALVIDETGRVLLGQRADNGRWALPSGISEPGETMAASCAREVLEETGVEVEVTDLISISTTEPIVYPNGDRTVFVDHFFACRPTGGEAVVGDDESLAVGWFELSALPEPLGPATPRLIAEGEKFAVTGRTLFDR